MPRSKLFPTISDSLCLSHMTWLIPGAWGIYNLLSSLLQRASQVLPKAWKEEWLLKPPSMWTETAMAPHPSTLAWKISWTEEPGGLQSVGSLRVGHHWATSLSLFTFMHRRRKWQPSPVFLPGESQGRRSLVGCRLWGCTELDMTEAT